MTTKEATDSPLFRQDCADCQFCDGLRDFDASLKEAEPPLLEDQPQASALFKSLSFLDRWLALFILLSMILGVLIGVYAETHVRKAFGGAQWHGVSIPVMIGLLLMMWPVLTKVRYECLPEILSSKRIWVHIAISFVLNWVIAPFVMLGIAWATLPEAALERERKGVLLIGVARCIAMVLIWTGLAKGDMQYCAILVGINSLLQVVLFSPYALLFVNILGSSSGSSNPALRISYSAVSVSVGIYLGIPLAAGCATRAILKNALTPRRFENFLRLFGPVALLGLLYTIIVLFANQGRRIVDNVGSVFRIFVPLILYFCIVWVATFFALNRFGRRIGGYDLAVVQAFTAGSNNFELAIAVAIANFGTDSPEALAATIGPLVEVPVLLGLTYVALWLKPRMRWQGDISLV